MKIELVKGDIILKNTASQYSEDDYTLTPEYICVRISGNEVVLKLSELKNALKAFGEE